jgi:hypothetical protein
MEPSDYYDAPIDKVIHFIRGVELIKSQSKRGKHKLSLKDAVQGLDFYGPPLIHTYITYNCRSTKDLIRFNGE